MKHDLLIDIADELLQNIHLFPIKFEKNRTVHEAGDSCKTIDLVCSGRLVAYTLSETGEGMIIFEFTQGAVLGANLLFAKNNRYPLTIYCEEDGEVISINKEDVEYLLRNEPNFIMQFIHIICDNSVGMNRRLTMYTQKSLRENILDYLKTLAVAQHSHEVVLPMTKKQMADYFGVRRPSLFRELKKMKDEGLIEIDNRTVRLITH